MKKVLIMLTTILLVSLFVSCGSEPVVEITIRFDGNKSTSGTMADQTVVRGEGFALPDNTFKKTGYEFMGWNTEADGSGTNYPDGYFVSFIENTTLYAQWSFNGVAEIRFDANGGEGTMLPQWVVKGVETVLNQNKYSKEDFHFVGWNTKADGTGDTYSDADTATFEDDMTLYAQWYKKAVEIRFDANGGGGLMFPQWVQKGVATALKPNRFSWKGHLFIGWNTKKDGSGTKYDDLAEITADSDVILYAQWAMDIVAMDDKYNWNESDSRYFSFSEDLTLKDDRVEVNGNVVLLLAEGKTLSLDYGIGVNKGNSLIIDGSGSLDSRSLSVGYSGIGVDNLESECGDITINSGNIYAQGGAGGAGIGGSYACDGGKITINGGTIEAKGGSSDWFGYEGAGIGGGGKGSGGTVIINGGKVTATGRDNSDGIGKGQNGESKGTLTLTGVTLEVSDDGKTWSPYKSDKRHRYMRTK